MSNKLVRILFRAMLSGIILLSGARFAHATGNDGIEKSYFSVLAGSPLVSNSSPLLLNATATLTYPVESETSRTIKNIISLSIFEETPAYIPANFTASVRILIEYGPSSGSISSFLDTLEVTYNKNDAAKYNARQYFHFTGAQYVRVTVQGIDAPVISGFDTKTVLILQQEMRVTRYYTLANNVQPVNFTTAAPGPRADEMQVSWSWPANAGNTHTQLEWAWLENELETTFFVNGNLNYDLLFRNNSTRVDLPVAVLTYSIPLLYGGNGKIYCRIRAVNLNKSGSRADGPWATPQFRAYAGLHNNLNWQATIKYADDGLHSATIIYFDGSLRARQSASKNNVTGTAIAGETFYDAQGRVAVVVLPSPIDSTNIGYTPGLNLFKSNVSLNLPNNQLITDDHAKFFDLQPIVTPASITPAMHNANGAGKYFSNANTGPGTAAIPDAEGYPYTVTRYTPDATGRKMSESAPGAATQMGKGHETKFYYGSPAQEELDGLFGTEAGNHTHYFKNMIKDANGQMSVSYVDMNNRTIATALAGEAPPNITALNLAGGDYPNQSGTSITRNLLDNNSNVVKNSNSIESINSLLVPATATYTFRYELNPQVLQLADCNAVPICYDCMYNLEISITDEAGDLPPFVKKFNNVSLSPDDNCATPIGSFKNDTTTAVSNVIQFAYQLPPGSYTIRKTLTISESSLQTYKALYLTKGLCKTEQQLIDSVYNSLLTVSECDDPPPPDNCTDCLNKLGDFNTYRNNYLNSIGNPNPVPDEVTLEIQAGYNAAMQNCNRLCNTLSMTSASKRNMMLADMVPFSGQYAKESGSGTMYNKYDIFSTTTPLTQPFYKKPKNSSKAPDFYRLITGTVDGTIHPTGDNTFLDNTTKDVFAGMFVNSWAQALLPHHPEYDKLVYAEGTLGASYNWIATFNSVNDYGYNGNAYLFTSSGTLTDPFYNIATGMKAAMVTKITVNYRNNLSLWQIAYGEAVCKNIVDPAQRNTCYTTAPKVPPYNNLTTDQKNQVWKVFRNMYAMERDNDVNAHIAATVSLPDAASLVSAGYILHFPTSNSQLAQQYGSDWTWYPATPASEPNITNIPGGTTPAATYASRCSSYVQQWTAALTNCPQLAANPALVNQITSAMITVCQKGSDSYNAFGSSEVAPTTPVDGSPRSFEELIDNILATNGISRTNLCNPFVIEFPKPYSKGPRFTAEVVNAIDTCHCKRFDQLKLAAHAAGKDTTSLTSFNEYLSSAYGETFTATLFASLRQGCSIIKNTACYDTVVRVSIGCSDPIPCNCVVAPPNGGICYVDCSQKICNNISPYPLPSPQPLPEFLKCGFTATAKCVSCAQLSALVTEFKSEFSSPYNAGPVFGATDLTPTNIRDNILFAQFVNFRTGFQFNWMDYAQAAGSATPACNLANYATNGGATQSVICRSPKTLDDTTTVFVTDPPCQKIYNMAVSLATQIHMLRQEILLADFEKQYRDKCLAAKSIEQFTVAYTNKEYHYTLFYYDMAGNLVKTLPPAAVRPNFSTAYTNTVKAARAAGTIERPPHVQELGTNYRYNSLGMAVAQKTPDAGLVKFWYDKLGRPVVSQDAQQAADGKYRYTIYDDLSRVIEIGQKPQTLPMTNTRAQNPGQLNSWLNGGGTKEEITYTVYDVAYPPLLATYITQQNLRNRVSYTYTKNLATDAMHFTATYFTYDVHGNVDTLLQDYKGIPEMDASNNRFKLIAYQYDLITGRVRSIGYQPGKADAFYHRYTYDPENRLTAAETSRDRIYWERDAAYSYYRHGLRSRTELGQMRVQGMDYAFTLRGWLKGVNSTEAGSGAFDIGGDGNITGANPVVARDVAGYALHYYDAVENGNTWIDYTPIGAGNAFARPGAAASLASVYNGNIAAISLSNAGLAKGAPATTNALPLFFKYGHDQLNRLLSMQVFKGLNTGTNVWSPVSISDYGELVTYDPNGNIKTYNRKGAQELGSAPQMDQFRYNYELNSNRLNYVHDTTAAGNYSEDIDAQSPDNYTYDLNGNIRSDQAAGIAANGISWNAYGKLAGIVKGGTTITYAYDARHARIYKNNNNNITIYVRDYSGNVLSVYEKLSAGNIKQKEIHLYGSKRIGILTQLTVDPKTEMLAPGYGTATISTFTRNEKLFEITNHLANVLVTIGDKKIQHTSNSTTVDYYLADIASATDYYPFGMMMPGRKFVTPADYRYGYNGMELDDDCGCGEIYTTLEREYDARLGRWMSVDPLQKELPWQSPYVGMDNKPVIRNDENGDCPQCIVGAVVGALLEIVFQVGEHMMEGDDFSTAFSKIDWWDVAGEAGWGFITGAFSGGVGKIAKAMADPKKSKILNMVVEEGMDQLVEWALRQGWDWSGMEDKIYGWMGKAKLSWQDLGKIGKEATKNAILEKYKGQKIQIVEEVYGKFTNGDGGTYFDFIVMDEKGEILEVAESKAHGHKTNNAKDYSKQQKRFYEGGETVILGATEASKRKMTGKEMRINNTTVNTATYRWRVHEYTGRAKSAGTSFLRRIFKKKK